MTRGARANLRRILGDVLATKYGRALLLTARDEWAMQLDETGAGRGRLIRHTPAEYRDAPLPARKFEVGIVACGEADVAPAPFEQLISRLRDLDCERVYVYRPQAASLEDDRLVRALGLRLLRTYPDEGATEEGGRLYYFDIFDYKDIPDWLNDRYWANPRMWDKARW